MNANSQNPKETKTQHEGDEWLPGFFYTRQKDRSLNPIYIFFTKEGFAWLVAVLVYFYFIEGGVFSLLLFGLALGFIYRNYFFYKFYQKESLWLYESYIKFKNKRRKRTIQVKPLMFERERRRKKEYH